MISVDQSFKERNFDKLKLIVTPFSPYERALGILGSQSSHVRPIREQAQRRTGEKSIYIRPEHRKAKVLERGVRQVRDHVLLFFLSKRYTIKFVALALTSILLENIGRKIARLRFRPAAGSLSDIRGRKANAHILREILELCDVIYQNGTPCRDQPDITGITFGDLFNIYTHISDKCVGLLLRARKQGLVNFEGECLFQVNELKNK